MPNRQMTMRGVLGLLVLAALAGCGRPIATTPSAFRPTAAASTTPSPTARPTAHPSAVPTPTALPTATPDPADDPVFAGAGDIAYCGSDGAEATARLLDAIEGTVFTLGDNAYEAGTAEQFRDCYDLTWGRHKARTRPAPGNHDYGTPGAAGYFDYFGEQAGPDRRGYYSFDLGAWHIISLNSEIAAGPNSEQASWLRSDLDAHPAACTLAYWHRPLFSSGSVHGNDPHMRTIWEILARASADVVLNGHEHIYERFTSQNVDGVADPQGMRQFVAGMGGASLYGIGRVQPNSEVIGRGVFGVLKLTLHASSYDWEFVPVEGGTFQDAGSAACVGAP